MTSGPSAPTAFWPLVLNWGVGWTVGPVFYFGGFALLVHERMPSVAFLLIGLAGACAFGLPAIIAARRTNSRTPMLQGLAWVACFFVAMSMVALTFAEPHQMARPGELNINTTESMLERQQSFDRWGLPPEAIARRNLLRAAVLSFAFAGGVFSALIAGAHRPAWTVVAVLTSGLAAGAGVMLGAYVALFMAATYFLLPVAGLGGGCVAGTAIEPARRLLLSSSPD